jgi:alkylation response protein AidB-like acyl-CoA dehydrogenase
MDFGFTDEQLALRGELRELLSQEDVREELEACRVGTVLDGHPRALYQELGRRGWLAIDWPSEYGGLGLTAVEAAIVAEELALHGVPDSARVNTIDNVGACILGVGTAEQRQAWLPPMAAGQTVASVLFTEYEAGSDLASLQTRADRMSDGWRLHGTKVWNAKSAAATYGLCAARTDASRSGYAGLTLFLIRLDAPGVRVEPVPTLNPEQLYEVRLDGVAAGRQEVVGEVGGGWQVVEAALARERGGLVYYGRARRWLDMLLDRSMALEGVPNEEAVILDALVESGRVLAWSAVKASAGGDPDPVQAARAKWYNSELARRVALVAQQVLGVELTVPGSVLHAAYLEAPGLTLSAGSSETMLRIMASALAEPSEAA